MINNEELNNKQPSYSSYDYFNDNVKDLLLKIRNEVTFDEELKNTIDRNLFEIAIRIKNKEPFFDEYLAPILSVISLKSYSERIYKNCTDKQKKLFKDLKEVLLNLQKIESAEFYHYTKPVKERHIKDRIPNNSKDSYVNTMDSYKPSKDARERLF